VHTRLSRHAIFAALCACAWSIVPALARADTSAPDPRVLALADALLGYCSKADPSDAAKVEAHLKAAVAGASKERLAQVRSTDAYRRVYDSEVDFIGKVDERNARRICSESIVKSRR
jgi:hypothetical protein